MRTSSEISPENDDEAYVWGFDQIQIDNPRTSAFERLVYLERLDTMLSTVTRLVPPGSSIADIGCAQGNLALLLGEKGYRVDAYDLNPRFLAYAEKKRTSGEVQWISANAFEIADQGSYDLVVLGEILEHVAHPDELLTQALSLVRPGGWIVATTPNGRYVRNPLPSYAEVIARGDQERLEREQFGPGGEHHLFAYTLSEIEGHVPAGGRLTEVAFLGSGLYNSHVQRILDRPRLGSAYRWLVRRAMRIAPLSTRLGATVMVVIQRKAS